MRLVFAGTPEFAERALSALLDAGHAVSLVLTQPDRPAGRGMRASPSAVKQLALARGIEVFQPAALREPAALERIRAAEPDALVVAAYGLLLPRAVLDVAPQGALNIHASLLPRWRGAAPIQRALIAGDRETGISIMRMDAGLDTGPVLARQRIAIDTQDDAQTLHDKLAALGARMIVAALAEVAAGRARAVPQPEDGATYARKIDKREALIDWQAPVVEVERLVRALRPWPGAAAPWRGEALKIWRATADAAGGKPGTVLESGPSGILVACGKGALRILELQRAGGRRLGADAFLRGCAIDAGERLQ
ncbi:MAG TPA: methionyl-tRNA formyltransferase [Burkholderiales bacterium]|nr:methionyl-tRNA formyltransferase [Burkholderiales bacterium]